MKWVLQTVLVAMLAGGSARAAGAPRIQFDRSVYDFGVTTLVDSVTGTFTFQNVGDGVLELGKPKPSCGCTVASVKPETLNPGEKGELVFTIKVGTAAQRLDKEIYVPSNDPQNSNVVLGISIETLSLFKAQPPAVSFGDVRIGTVTNTTITIKRTDGKKLTITNVKSSSDLLSAKVASPEKSDGPESPLRVELKGGNLPRPFSEMLQLYTDDSIGAAFTIFVSAQLVGDITIEPESLSWGMPDPKDPSQEDIEVELSQSVIVSATQTNHPLVLRNVSSNLKDLKVELVTVEKGKTYEIVATFPKRLDESVHGTVTFETNLASLPKVEVPLEVNVWKR